MPRPLDVDKRKEDIARIAFDVLARGGPSGLTIQAVAEELGGSVTKVTHIYPTRSDLMRGTVELFVSGERRKTAESEGGSRSPLDDLRAELLSMIPIVEADRRQERGRIALISDKDQDSARVFADGMEAFARSRLRDALHPLVGPDELEAAVDFYRALVNGIVLSTIEHPDHWTPERQRRAVEIALRAGTPS